MKKRNPKSLIAIIWILIGTYFLLFSWIAWRKYVSFSFRDIDLAILNQTFWNTIHGRIVCISLGQGTILNGGHVFFIIFLLAPLYALFPSPLTPLFLQSLALALGAWPIYLLGKELLKPSFGLLLALCYLIYPALNYVNLFEFHPIAFATPLLLATFYFYVKKQWRWFCIFIALSLACREDVAIPVFAIGIFALIGILQYKRGERRRELKWAALPLLSALIWFFFCVKFLQPHFRPAILQQTEFAKGGLVFYGWLGDSLSEVIKTIIFHPGRVLRGILIKPKLLYLFHLSVPVAFLPIFSPSALLMTLLSLSEGLLSQRDTHFSIHWQYSSIITPLVFISSIYGVRNILRWKWMVGKKKIIFSIVLLFSIVSAKTLGPLFTLPEGVKVWLATDEDKIRQELVEEIPLEATVITTFEFGPKLSMRPRLFYFFYVYAVSVHPNYRYYIAEAQKFSQYALIDFDDRYSFYAPDGDKSANKFLREGRWGVEESVNNLVLFRKGYDSPFHLIKKVKNRSIAHPLNLEVANGLKLLSVDIKDVRLAGRKMLDFSCYMKAETRQGQKFIINPVFIFRDNPDVYFEQPLLAPHRILPTNRWEVGAVYKQRCRILVPEKLPTGVYNLRLALEVRKPLITQRRMKWKVWRDFIYEEEGVFVK